MRAHMTGYIIALMQQDYNISSTYYFGRWKEEVISVVINSKLVK